MLEKQKTQAKANDMARAYYDYECIFSGRRKADGFEIDASHIFPIGQTKFKGLSRYPVAALPMWRPLHEAFEWSDINKTIKREPIERINFVLEHVLFEYEKKVREQIAMLLGLCAEKRIKIGN